MQSFRERSGFRGNQHCHQQELYEFSRLENYRYHHSQNRPSYEAQSLTGATASAADTGAKDCYSQQAYPGYGRNSAVQEYKGAKIPSQHLPGGYSSHRDTAYSAQFVNEGNLQQKWESSSRMSQYEQDVLGRLESRGAGDSGTQFQPQNMPAISQNQWPHASHPSSPVFTSHHQQKVPKDTALSSMAYIHGHLQFPQHSQSVTTPSPSHAEKCKALPHCYNNYPMPPNSQYSGQPENNSLKQNCYRSQNDYVYQQPSSRNGYERQSPSQGIPSTQDNLSKYQHFSQPQQNYCLSDISVRSSEQYYQNCSPNISHSPARSVERSPSYNSTSSPLMINSETFLYNQPAVTSGASSLSSVHEQSLHMSQQSHPSPSIKHQTTSYACSLKDKFSEKLLSNPSLWSLNALTSQVENISNNVQQLLLSEAFVANKKGSKRNNPKQAEDFKGQLHTSENRLSSDAQHHDPMPEAFSTTATIHTELQEGRYTDNIENQQERSYYYCGQDISPAHATINPQISLDVVPTNAMTSPYDMSLNSEASLRTAQAECDTVNPTHEELRTNNSPICTPVPGSLSQQQNTSAERESPRDSARDNLQEESVWSEKLEEKGRVNERHEKECEKQADANERKQEEEAWVEEEKCLSVLHKISDALSDNNYPDDKDEKMYQDLIGDYSAADGDASERLCDSSGINCRRDAGSDLQPETCKSELPPDSGTLRKRGEFVWADEYLSTKEDDCDLPHESSKGEPLKESLSPAPNERLPALEEQHSVFSDEAAEVSEEESAPSPEKVINNTTRPLESGKCLCQAQEQGSKHPANVDAEVQDTDFTSSENRSVICDIAPLTSAVKTVSSVSNEETTPQSQARERIDRCKAAVLEPESPQIPGKSLIHSAPSWADTPPSPQKGDEEIDPGISFPSPVTPSAKSELMATSENLGVFNGKHLRGRRRQSWMLMHSSVRIRRLPSVEGDSVPAAPLEMDLPPNKAMVFMEQARTTHKDPSRQAAMPFVEYLPSRMCTRSFSAMATPKTCHRLKREQSPKPSKAGVVKDSQGDPEGMVSKIKWRNRRGPKPMILGHRRGRKSLSENREQDENKETAERLSSCVKVQRPMILRSRKQSQENSVKEKPQEGRAMRILPKALKEIKRQSTAFLKEQGCEGDTLNCASVFQGGECRTVLSKSDKNESSFKRKSNCHSPSPVKRQRRVKRTKPEIIQSPKLMRVRGPKRRLMQGENFNIPLRSFLAKDPMTANIADIPCISPQHPAKTKYLPPRKGRGQKYEAMVQKITSSGSKKLISNPQAENIQDNLMTRNIQQGKESNIEAENLKPKQCAITENMAEAQESKASKTKWTKKQPPEHEDKGKLASGPESLVINTPRLAKQRAIQNNHEIHLKQRRKRRKGLKTLESTVSAEQWPPSPAIEFSNQEKMAPKQTLGHTSVFDANAKCTMTSINKRQAEALALQVIKNETTVQGPKRRNNNYLHDIEAITNYRQSKIQHRLHSDPVVEGQQPETGLKYITCQEQRNENKPFCPYVYIDSSEEFASICAVVNGPDEELPFQERKKTFPKMQNPAAKVIPNSSIMLQGPLVNKNLNDRSLTCCLCGKPANYRELGDLCGPYYPEDSVPRKAMSFKYELESKDNGLAENCSSEQTSTPLKETEKSLTGKGSGTRRRGRPKKTDKASRDRATARPKFLERYKKLQLSQSAEKRGGEKTASCSRSQDGSGTISQKLKLEVEAKEHWLHEACAVWTSGIFLVAGKLYGLQEAMDAAAEERCSKCQDVGASVSCCGKGCHQKFHYVCAKEIGCLLQEESISLKCTKHKAF